jgi:SAM-dependent methyltransferase
MKKAAGVSGRVYGVSRVAGNSRLQTDVLEDLADARRYRRWLADLARPYLGAEPIEIGSGTGDYAMEWLPSVRAFTATEGDEDRLRSLKERFTEHPRITVRHLLLGQETQPEGTHRYTGAVALNVLEHIDDHVEALRAAGRLVQPGGAVVLIVPAFPFAMSRFDLDIGHQRRYTRASLREALEAAGLRVETLRYLNPVGLLSWVVSVKTLRMTPRNGLALRTYDRTIVPIARLLDRMPAPFGQSVFAVARV